MKQGKASKWFIVFIVLVMLVVLNQCSKSCGSGGSSGSSSSSGKTAICNNCHGTGYKNGSTCVWCGGSGRTYDNKFNDYLK